MKRFFFPLFGLLLISNISLSQNIHGFNFLSGYTFEEIKQNIEYTFREKIYEIESDYSGYRIEVKLNEENEYQIIVFEFRKDRYDNLKNVLTRAYCSNTSRQFSESLYNETIKKYGPPSKGYIEERQDKGIDDKLNGKSIRHEVVYSNRFIQGDGILVRFYNSIFAAGMQVVREYHFEISYSAKESNLSYCEPHSNSPLLKEWKIIKTFR